MVIRPVASKKCIKGFSFTNHSHIGHVQENVHLYEMAQGLWYPQIGQISNAHEMHGEPDSMGWAGRLISWIKQIKLVIKSVL